MSLLPNGGNIVLREQQNILIKATVQTGLLDSVLLYNNLYGFIANKSDMNVLFWFWFKVSNNETFSNMWRNKEKYMQKDIEQGL